MGHADILHQIQRIGKRVLPEDARLYLYGSRARGDYHDGSDWDLLILLNRPQEATDFQNIAYPIMELGFDLGEYFSVQTYSQEEWEAMSFLPYYKNVEQDKIVLVWVWMMKETSILPKEDGAFYSQLQTLREKSDYNCTYYATEQDTAPRIAMTEAFIEKVIGLIKWRKKARQSCRTFFLAFPFYIANVDK